MPSENLIPFPVLDPESFSPDINREVLATSEFRRLIYAAIEALPYIDDERCGEELKQALCQLIAPEWRKQ